MTVQPDDGTEKRYDYSDLMEDRLVDIEDDRVSYFGSPRSKMLRPSIATVANLIRQVAEGQLITTDILRRVLAFQFEAQTTSWADIKRILKAISSEPDTDVPYWRVIKGAGDLITDMRGGSAAQAERLAAEGFTIEPKGKSALKVKNFRDYLNYFNTEFKLPDS